MWARWWRSWFRPRLPGVRVVVYSRSVCPLCNEAKEFLNEQQRRLGFQLQEIDVDSDADLQARHGEWAPVVEVNGKVHFRGSINPMLWSRLVRALARLRDGST